MSRSSVRSLGVVARLRVAEAERDVPQRHGGRSDRVVLRPLGDEPVRQAGDDGVGHGVCGRVDLHDRHLRQSELGQPVGTQQTVVEVVVVEHVPLLGVGEGDLLRRQLQHPRRQQLDDDAVVLAPRAGARGCERPGPPRPCPSSELGR